MKKDLRSLKILMYLDDNCRMLTDRRKSSSKCGPTTMVNYCEFAKGILGDQKLLWIGGDDSMEQKFSSIEHYLGLPNRK